LPKLNLWAATSQVQSVRPCQETGGFAEANRVAELTQIVVRLVHRPVSDGVDEVQGRMPTKQFEAMCSRCNHPEKLITLKLRLTGCIPFWDHRLMTI